jgi:hypothetical protein
MANRRFIDFPIAASVGDNDIVLIWQDGLNKQTTKATLLQGSPSSLAGLTDVDIAGLINGQILQYNSTTSKWENVDRTDINLSELGDVTIVAPANGQVLVYNSSTSKWENSSAGYVPYTGAVTTVNLGAQSILAGSFVKAGGTSAQFLKADGSVDSSTYGTGTVTSVALTMPAAFSVANSPVTTAGTLAVTATGTTSQYIRGDGSLETFPALTGFVPYTGATADVNLGTHDLAAERGTFQNNGSSDTLTVNHTSGSGYGIIVTKGGNNEALYVSKTSGSGNAMTVVGGRTSLVDLALSSVTNTAGDFLTLSGGVVHKRTAAEVRTDIGAGTVTSVGLSSATSGVTIGSTPITTSGTITLAIATASGSQNGLLSSTDWTTFNSKQPAGSYVTLDTTQTITGQKTISRTAALFSGTKQSFLIDGSGGESSVTINSGTINYAYQTFAQNQVGKFEIGIVGPSGNGSFYINRTVQVGETGASIYVKKADGFVGINNINPTFQLDVTGNGKFLGSSTVTAKVLIEAGNQWSLNADQSGAGTPAFAGSGFYIKNENTSTIALGFDTGGAATFVNTLKANTTTITNGTRSWIINPSGASIQEEFGGVVEGKIDPSSGGNSWLGATSGTTGAGAKHYFSSTGAATFAGGVTAGGVVTITASGNSQPLVLNNQNNEQYLYINSASNREAMTQYYNATAGNWYTGIRNSAGLGTTSSYHIYSSTYGNDVFVLNTNATAKFASTLETTGIKFPATQVGSADSNTLDDYEEGTWTPTLPNGGTLAVVNARYVKIGQKVTVSLYVNSVNPTNNSSEFRIGGLPFENTYSSPSLYYGGSFGYVGASNLSTYLPITGSSFTYIYFHINNGNGATKTNANYITDAGANGNIIMTITYFAAT